MKRVRLVKRTSKLTMTSLDQALYFSCLQRVNVCVRDDCVTVIQAKQCLLYIIQQFCNISSQALKTKARRNIWFSEINNEGTFYVLIRLTRWIIAFFNVSWNCLFNERKKKMSLALITVYVTATTTYSFNFCSRMLCKQKSCPITSLKLGQKWEVLYVQICIRLCVVCGNFVKNTWSYKGNISSSFVLDLLRFSLLLIQPNTVTRLKM